MDDKNQIVKVAEIQNRIFTIRGLQVMVDSDLAQMYAVETKNLNRAVKRNIDRFPKKFRFQITDKEWESLRLQMETSNGNPLRFQSGTLKDDDAFLHSNSKTIETERGKHRKYLPFVFTEQGIAMLSAVLRSNVAVHVSIQIMDAFVEMRKFIATHAGIFQRLENVEQKLLDTDGKFEQIFKAIEDKSLKPKQGIFYDGQVFDAYVFISDLVKSANKSILLIDNYIDESVLQLFTKRKENVMVSIYTKNYSKILKQDLEKHNVQYPKISIEKFTQAHDRFLIIDKTTVYHIGASLKDLGKKWFAFSKISLDPDEMLLKLK